MVLTGMFASRATTPNSPIAEDDPLFSPSCAGDLSNTLVSLNALERRLRQLVTRHEEVLQHMQYIQDDVDGVISIKSPPLDIAADKTTAATNSKADEDNEELRNLQDVVFDNVQVSPTSQYSDGGDMRRKQTDELSTLSERELRLRAQARREKLKRISLEELEASIVITGITRFTYNGSLRRVVVSRYFDGFFGSLIILNTIIIGVQVQLMANSQDTMALALGQHIFTLAFFVELVLRLCAFRLAFFCVEDWMWNCFDLLLVAASMIELYTDVSAYFREAKTDGSASSTLHLRLFRIMRILARVSKLMRVLRLSRWVQPFRVLLLSTASAIQNMFWIMLFFGMYIFVFSILFTTATLDYATDVAGTRDATSAIKWFGGLDRTAITIYMSLTGGVDWEIPMEVISQVHLGWQLCFLFMQFFNYFAVLNLITGVYCQSAIESALSDQQTVIDERVRRVRRDMKAVQGLFSAIDTDQDGTLTLDELARHLDDPYILAFFKAVDIDSRDAWKLFSILDKDSSDNITLEEFCEGCLSLRGPARAPDMFKVHHEMKHMRKQMKDMRRTMNKAKARSDKQAENCNLMMRSLQIQALPSSRRAAGEPLPEASQWAKQAAPDEATAKRVKCLRASL